MGRVDIDNIEQISRIPVEAQLQICKEAALAFGYLCKTVCERFGQEGAKVVAENFLSDSDPFGEEMPHIKENPSKEVSMTLIKLLASWGINRGSCVE